MNPRPHPFPGKLSLDEADEVRRLRRDGVPLAELAERFGIAKSSVSAIVKHKSHEIPGTFRITLPEPMFDLLRELADDVQIPVEQLASDLLVKILRSRAW